MRDEIRPKRQSTQKKVTRRAYLKRASLASTVGIIGFAGCMGNGGGSGGNGSGGSNSSAPLEIIHWWTAGGEEQAFNALIKGFKKKYPNVKVKPNPAPGGAGSAQAAVVRNRVLSDNPPSTFQIWPGKALHPYTKENILKGIGDIWTQDMRKAYLKGPQQLSKPQGTYVAVPINIHRLNNIFYNKNIIKQAGVDPANIQDPASLTKALAKVEQNTDAVGMAQATKTPFTTIQLWEMIFLGAQGVQAYQDMVNGNIQKHKQGIKSALRRVNEYRKHWNKDAGSISWNQANAMVINGKAAFHHQGDWAVGQYKAQKNFEFRKDWDYIPFPATDETYSIVVDSFVYPKNNPTPDATRKFLSYCGSKDAQRRFNPIKGSIPPRTDVSMKPFGPFLKEQQNDFASSQAQPPTIAHGTAVTPSVKTAVEGAFASFTSNWNINQTYTSIRQAFKQG
jgi:glucose/mannose transport system substrate-binding protein